ncbi:universal stress protein [Streptomyces monticola]|uniref:Universal stress protein n=1 Tax=Streptomyces monticola TaxID=2666263 RepID=A0ABW2JD69_9ACTN
MERELTVGVDGSEAGLQALDWAVDEAVRCGVPLRIVHGSSWEWYEGHEPSFSLNRDAVRQHAERLVEGAAQHVLDRARAVRVTAQVLPDEPAAALIRESGSALAVVVGSRGRGELAGLLLGSVSLSVAAHAECPVIVVRGAAAGRTGVFGRVTVGVGDPQEAASAVEFALRSAERRGAALDAVHAWRCPAHEVPDHPRAEDLMDEHRSRAEAALAEALPAATADRAVVAVRRVAVEGRSRTALLDASARSDLLVVGAHRRKGHLGMHLGPVNHAVLHHAKCPVALIPHD